MSFFSIAVDTEHEFTPMLPTLIWCYGDYSSPLFVTFDSEEPGLQYLESVYLFDSSSCSDKSPLSPMSLPQHHPIWALNPDPCWALPKGVLKGDWRGRGEGLPACFLFLWVTPSNPASSWQRTPPSSGQLVPVGRFPRLQRCQHQQASTPSSASHEAQLELRNPSTRSIPTFRGGSFSCIEPFAWVSKTPASSFGSS